MIKMSENEDELKQKLAEKTEEIRLNAIKMLKFLGYDKEAKDLSQAQIDARIELLLEQRKNREIEATKKGNTDKPSFFKGIDEERENMEKVKNAAPSELDMSEYMKGYDALTAHIPQLRPNSQVGHAESFAPYEQCRIIRLPASIKLNDQTTIMRRVVL